MGIADKIKFYNNSVNKIIIKNGNIYRYELHSRRINQGFKIEELLDNQLLLKEIIEKGFDSYEKKFEGREKTVWDNGAVTFSRRHKKFYIPISQNFIEYYQLNWTNNSWNKDYITLSNTHLSKENVDSFYEFSIEVEIQGLRIGDSLGEFSDDKIQFSYPKDNEELKARMIKLFGEAKVHPQNEGDKYGRFANNYFFLPKSRIDKIIGIKKYRDTSNIGQPDGELFTGETEEIILDLHNFDEDIYKIFKEHGMLEIQE